MKAMFLANKQQEYMLIQTTNFRQSKLEFYVVVLHAYKNMSIWIHNPRHEWENKLFGAYHLFITEWLIVYFLPRNEEQIEKLGKIR